MTDSCVLRRGKRGRKPTGRMKPCKLCGTPFYCQPSRDVGGSLPESTLCSRACMHAAKKYTPEVRAERFWARVDKSAGETACWPWLGAITTHGYGCVAAGGFRVKGAHKAAYEFAKGPVGAGLHVMHACDNRRCCNPAHLTVGTRQDNMSDMAAKGRGRKDGLKKLTATQAHEIKSLRGKATSGEIAKQFGITQSYVFGIWAGRVWRTA